MGGLKGGIPKVDFVAAVGGGLADLRLGMLAFAVI
jgi:hypothetical protein